jgi:hypothetical protein
MFPRSCRLAAGWGPGRTAVLAACSVPSASAARTTSAVPEAAGGTLGDAARTRTPLRAWGLTLPVKITVAHRKGLTAERAMAALQRGWQDAGLSVTLLPITKNYVTNIGSVANSRGDDVMWAVETARWLSGSREIPPWFDSRLNLTAGSSGQGYGRFASRSFGAKIDAAAKIPDGFRRERVWGLLTEQLAAKVAAMALTSSSRWVSTAPGSGPTSTTRRCSARLTWRRSASDER